MGAQGALTASRMAGEAEAAKAARRSEGRVATALASVSVFSLCSKRELKLVAKLAKTKPVRAGVTLMTEGEQGESLFVILSGGATVTKARRKIAEIGPGEVVGELAPLSKAPRNATVVVRSDSVVAELSRRDLYRLIDDAPGFSRKLLEALANRLRESDRKIVC